MEPFHLSATKWAERQARRGETAKTQTKKEFAKMCQQREKIELEEKARCNTIQAGASERLYRRWIKKKEMKMEVVEINHTSERPRARETANEETSNDKKRFIKTQYSSHTVNESLQIHLILIIFRWRCGSTGRRERKKRYRWTKWRKRWRNCLAKRRRAGRGGKIQTTPLTQLI